MVEENQTSWEFIAGLILFLCDWEDYALTSMQWGDGWRRPSTGWSGQSQVIVNRDTGTGQCLKNTYDTLRYNVWGDKHPFTIYLSTTVFDCANSANPGISFFKNVFYSHVHMDGVFFQASFDHIFIVFARTLKWCEPLGCQDPPRPLRGLLWGPLRSPWGLGGELREFEELRVVGFG